MFQTDLLIRGLKVQKFLEWQVAAGSGEESDISGIRGVAYYKLESAYLSGKVADFSEEEQKEVEREGRGITQGTSCQRQR